MPARCGQGNWRRLGDRRRQGYGALLRSSYHWWVGEHARAYELAADGLRSGSELGDGTLCASATYFMAISHEARGSYREAVRLLRPLSASPSSGISSAYGGPTAPAVFWTSHLARSLAELGDFGAARTTADDAMRLMARCTTRSSPACKLPVAMVAFARADLTR